MHPKLFLVASLGTLVAVALVSCGSDSKKSTSSNTTESTGSGMGSSSGGAPDMGSGGTSSGGSSHGSTTSRGQGGSAGSSSTNGGSGGEAGMGTSPAGAGGEAGGSPDDTLDADCRAHAHTFCSRLADCGPWRLLLDFEDEQTCEDLVGERCVADSQGGYGIADLKGCTSFLNQSDCDPVLDENSTPPEYVTGACQRERGPKPAGQPCMSRSQCASGYCKFSGTPCGVCLPALEKGEPCSNIDGGCQLPNLACDFDADECVEVSSSGVGEACGTETERCEGGLTCTDAGCKSALDENADCSADGSVCDFRRLLSCSESMLCKPAHVSALGESCSTEGGGLLRCSALAYCDPDTKTCVPRGKVGDPCTTDDPVAGHTCLPGHACRDGVCQSWQTLCQEQ